MVKIIIRVRTWLALRQLRRMQNVDIRYDVPSAMWRRGTASEDEEAIITVGTSHHNIHITDAKRRKV